MTAAMDHARKRATERYRLFLGGADMARIIRQIKPHHARHLRPDGRSEHAIRYAGRDMRVVYDASMETIVTVLPRNN